jgi:hypothetical protein
VTRRQVIVLLATAAVVLPLVYLGIAGEAGRGSALSRGPEGWLAARRYLEARGAEVRLLDRPPGAGGRAEAGGVLVEVFPWRPAAALNARGGGAGGGRAAALRRHVAAGGDLMIAYSGGYDPTEDAALEALGLGLRPLRDEPPLAPAAWWRDARLTWRLPPEVQSAAAAGDEPAGVLELPAPRWAPWAPAGAEVLYRSPEELPVAFALRRGRGRIVVVPAVALANASLADAGNADLLEGLLDALGRRWAFDEHAHGLAAPAAAGGRGPGLAFDLVIAHLVLLYLLAALALGRRFGPPWREAPAAAGSAAAFLLRLGALHDRLGHHGQAARKLVERWRELYPRQPPPEALARSAEDADAAGLVAVARALARRRHGVAAAGPSGGARSAILAGARPAGRAAETRR